MLNTLILGTGNIGKVRELREYLAGIECKIADLSEFDAIEEPLESGESFEENAAIKATYYAKLLGHSVLADDSGLEVSILSGRPGVYSSRFAGENANDTENNEKLLKELAALKPKDRSARFVCEMALAGRNGKIIFRASGSCPGTIARKPYGFNGFGYDPVFVPDGFDKTFAELPVDIKHLVGHRAKAASKIAHFIELNLGVLT